MSKPIGNCLLYKSFTSIRIHLKVFAQEDLIFLPFPLVSRSLWGQNGHLPAPRTSSMSTKPSNSFWQFKVSVTIRYRSCLRRGFLSNLLLQFMENSHVNHFNFTLPIKSGTSFSILPFEIRTLSILERQFRSERLPSAPHPLRPEL